MHAEGAEVAQKTQKRKTKSNGEIEFIQQCHAAFIVHI
jgi:hypothetical protein